MTNLDQYKSILMDLEGKSLREKNMRVAGIITEYVREKHNINLIVVGGLSVEIYTDGGYTTQDIDFVGPGDEEIKKCLVELGFKRAGKDSVHEKLNVYVEIPSSILKNADHELVNTIKTEDGFNINLIGIEDIFLDRTKATIHWKESMHIQWLTELYDKYKEKMDFVYIEKHCTLQEWEFIVNLINVIESEFVLEIIQIKLKDFLDAEQIPYSETQQGLIAFNTNNEFVGISIHPLLMHYQYDDSEDESFIPVQDTVMSVEEFLNYFQKYNNLEGVRFREIKDKVDFLINGNG